MTDLVQMAQEILEDILLERFTKTTAQEKQIHSLKFESSPLK